MKKLWPILAVAALTACSQPTNSTESADTAAQVAAESGGERFYGQERFTIVTRYSGRQTGTTTLHVRDWGRHRVEINDTSISAAGMTVPTRNRVIHEGARIVTIDDSGRATAIDNPLYGQVVEAMRGRSGVEFGQQIMTQMGGRQTGERGAFAGQDCEYWDVAQLGARTCVAPWGGTMHQTTSLAGINIEQTATEVRIGDGGPDEAFAYDPAAVTQGPNLNDIMGKMKGGG